MHNFARGPAPGLCGENPVQPIGPNPLELALDEQGHLMVLGLNPAIPLVAFLPAPLQAVDGRGAHGEPQANRGVQNHLLDGQHGEDGKVPRVQAPAVIAHALVAARQRLGVLAGELLLLPRPAVFCRVAELVALRVEAQAADAALDQSEHGLFP